MSFSLADIRLAVMEALGRSGENKTQRKSGNPYYYSLPQDISTHPSWIEWVAPTNPRRPYIGEDGKTYLIKVVSSEEAKQLNPKSVRPHRVYAWDEVCGKWVFLGKYCQHCKSITHKIRASAIENMPELLEKP